MTAPFLFVAAAALLRHSLQLVQISGVFVVAVKDDDYATARLTSACSVISCGRSTSHCESLLMRFCAQHSYTLKC